MQADLSFALARLHKKGVTDLSAGQSWSLCPLAGSLNPLGLTQVLSFSFTQHFKNMSMQINTLTVNVTMKGRLNTSFLS